MAKISSYDRVRLLLKQHVGMHNQIAKETGVPQSTVSRLHIGGINPRVSTVDKLLDWFDARGRKKHKLPPPRKSMARRVTAKPNGVVGGGGVGASPPL